MLKLEIKEVKDKNEWKCLLSCCENVNILQTWEYGEAKKHVEGWKPIRTALLQMNKPIGIAQTLTKTIPMIAGVARINRGPLIFPLKDHKAYVDLSIRSLSFLQYFWTIQKKMFLAIAPNINCDEMNSETIRNIGYSCLNRQAWASIVVDLSNETIILRKQLHQNWRNHLNKSERMNLSFEIDSSKKGFSFLMKQYKRMMREKCFSGMPVRLLNALRKATADSFSFQILFAVRNNIRVSGVLITGNEDTCHYLIGWNSKEGRQLQANYFLLWQCLLHFKKTGYRWFDLEGINERETPGITHFKRGVGGKEFTLIGEFKAFPKGMPFNLINKLRLLRI